MKFNVQEIEWSKCMTTCPKYNRAMVPSFTDKEKVDELIHWIHDTTTDPITKTLYHEAYSLAIWIPFRFELMLCMHCNFIIVLLI